MGALDIRRAMCLWAKKARDNEPHWLPLTVHMADSAALAPLLWDEWLSEGVRREIEGALSHPEGARSLFIFLAAAHDIGKATPVFQAKGSSFLPNHLDMRIEEGIIASGLPIQPFRAFQHPSASPHALATQLILQRDGFSDSICAILGAHHGKPADSFELTWHTIEAQPTNFHMGPRGEAAWTAVQRAVIRHALNLAGYESPDGLPIPNMPAQVLLSALVIMTDWIASNERLFPYIRMGDDPARPDACARVTGAWDALNLPAPWRPDDLWIQPDALYRHRFDYAAPRPVQQAVAQTVARIFHPGICIIEAATGIGKTEMALAAAEAFCGKSHRSGLFFALPTQATSDGLFPRVLRWVDGLDDGRHAMVLAHGKAQFNDEYQRLLEGSRGIYDEESYGAFVHSWFEGPKKSLLADIVVGTIDQLLMLALKQKHVMLRHLGLANKVVVIDECHAYDAYMSEYLDMALRWLGAYRVPVIILSATLPIGKRRALVDAYLNTQKPASVGRDLPWRRPAQPEAPNDWAKSRAYPLLTYTDGAEIRSEALPDTTAPREVGIAYINETSLGDTLSRLLSGGGCAGVMVNTVRRAQAIARTMRDRFGADAVRLLHARFLAPDRAQNERDLLRQLGASPEGARPRLLIVVGTQVLEQSLDIDFDLLITDLCPMDLLIQRMGRMHRHERTRPETLRSATCLILRAEDGALTDGAEAVYQRYLLMRTQALLPGRIVLPGDVPNLVQDAYDDGVPLSSEPPGYLEAREAWLKRTAQKEQRANTYRIGPPWADAGTTMISWLSRSVEPLSAGAALTDQMGEAQVRDSDASFEVLLIMEVRGELRFLPWIEGGRAIPEGELSGALAQAVARQRVRMPPPLCTPWAIRETIAQLEALNAPRFAAWQASPWLRGELVVLMDEDLSARLCGYQLRYDRFYGLSYQKEDTGDG